MVTTAVSKLRGMAWFLLLTAPQACSLVGRERGRSIPFRDIACLIKSGLASGLLFRDRPARLYEPQDRETGRGRGEVFEGMPAYDRADRIDLFVQKF